MVVRMERESRTDAELLRHSRRDPDAFMLVCRRHATALDGWLTAQVRDAGLARELLAETFSEAWFSRGRFSDPGDGDARPWLFGIARNLVRRVYRDRAVASRGRARLGLPVAAPDEYGEVIKGSLLARRSVRSTSTSRGCRSLSATRSSCGSCTSSTTRRSGSGSRSPPRERAPVSSARSRRCEHRSEGAPDDVRDPRCRVPAGSARDRRPPRSSATPSAAAARRARGGGGGLHRRGRARGELRGLVDGRGTPREPEPGRPRDRGEHDRAAGAGVAEGDRRQDPNAALVAVATKGGGYCLIPSLTGWSSIGNSCTSAPESELRTYASPSEKGGSRVWILYGRVIDDGAASLDLRGVGLTEPVPLARGGFFLRGAAPDGVGGARQPPRGGRDPGRRRPGSADGLRVARSRPGPLRLRQPVGDARRQPRLVQSDGAAARRDRYRPRRQARDDDTDARAQHLRAGRPSRHLARRDEQDKPATSSLSLTHPYPPRWRQSRQRMEMRHRDVAVADPDPSRDRQGARRRPLQRPRHGWRRARQRDRPRRTQVRDRPRGAYRVRQSRVHRRAARRPRAGKGSGPVPGGPYTAIGYDTHGNKVTPRWCPAPASSCSLALH